MTGDPIVLLGVEPGVSSADARLTAAARESDQARL